MSKLTALQRRALPNSSFALKGRRYPIHDINHARFALSLGKRFATKLEYKQIQRAVKSKFGCKIKSLCKT